MRHLTSIICVLGLFGPTVALAAEKEDLRDARCIAAAAAMVTQTKIKKSEEWIVTAVMLYSYGRLEGRGQAANLTPLIEEAVADEDKATLIARVSGCLEAMDQAMEALQKGAPE